ncbi:hypothetical protein [Nocardiopsis tropica]|uniref:Secreted protein n=1 Tax=Nocardiopsis tropica TaxID=109330 RepID=A0ABU7KMH7_9ACTN|nr:hypothetical protein [Nocardiopsis umidischolae]MEE2050495.1 hypothetical protein [Nocardiopsis umidischolae]
MRNLCTGLALTAALVAGTAAPAAAQGVDLSSLPIVGGLLGGGASAASDVADDVEDAVT